MIIDQLPEISTVQDTDEIPIERGTTTYKSPLSKIWARLTAALGSNVLPNMDGTAAIGSSDKYARADHVHPTDTNLSRALYFTSVACAATTGDFATVSNANITADFVVAECSFANPSAITTDVTWTTAAGSLKLSGTCSAATTANIVLVKKNN